MSVTEKTQPGVLFRIGGVFYFVPEKRLREFQLKDNNVDEARKELRYLSAKNSNILCLQGDFVYETMMGNCCALDIGKMKGTACDPEDDCGSDDKK